MGIPLGPSNANNAHDDKSSFRLDIQGLRAVAVLAVILFHLDMSPFTGGFVGVDIFFVISGYLITGLILREIEKTGQFNLRRFYIRRVRRLFPALAATLLLSFFAAAYIYTPEHLEKMSQSLIAAVFSVSNILFWTQSGYFDAAAITKPLLHTWSLSVEEQYYLFWPALLLIVALAFGAQRLWVLVVMVILFSLGANVIYIDVLSAENADNARETLFFLTPFRFYELALGAAVVWTERRFAGGPVINAALFCLGLVLMGLSIFVMSEDLPFPYLYALAPCIGAALVIQAGGKTKLARPLKISPVVYVGEISYSLYLVHWPLISFAVYYFDRQLVMLEKSVILFLSFSLAWILYRFVEQPFRYPSSTQSSSTRFGVIWGMTAIFLVSISYNAYSSGGWPWRVPDNIRLALQEAGTQRKETIRYERTLREGAARPFFDDNRKRILLIGDSMSRDLMATLKSRKELDSMIQLRRLSIDHSCQFLIGNRETMQGFTERRVSAKNCKKATSRAIRHKLVKTADIIIVWQRWHAWAPENSIKRALKALARNTNAKIFVIGRKVEFHPQVAKLLQRHALAQDFERTLYTIGDYPEVNAKIEAAAQATGAIFVDPTPLQCESERCFAFADSGRLLYWDWGHWSLEGNAFFAARLEKAPELWRALSSYR